MSAMPARVTEGPERTSVTATPTPAQAPGPTPAPAERRADRRAQQKQARRSRQLWALLGCSILGGALGLTVGILDVLR
jgi:hypothetical protein